MGDEQPYENIKTKWSNSFFRGKGNGAVSKKLLIAKPDDLNLILETHRVEGKPTPTNCPDFYMHAVDGQEHIVTDEHTDTHTQKIKTTKFSPGLGEEVILLVDMKAAL